MKLIRLVLQFVCLLVWLLPRCFHTWLVVQTGWRLVKAVDSKSRVLVRFMWCKNYDYGCGNAYTYEEPYRFVPVCGCPVHDK